MTPEETNEATEEVDSVVPSHLVVFLPFLRLKQAYTAAGVEFVPLRTADGKVPESLQSGVAAIERILSGYLDKHGRCFQNCVVATIPGRGWDLQEDDFDTVRLAASLLFLAAWAGNEYFARFGGSYVSSTTFRLVAQRFGGDIPYHITLVTRLRHGRVTDGGYKHGELKFHVPLQVSLRDEARIDEGLLVALGRAMTAGVTTIDLLRTALPFVELANTDDDFMTPHNEAILMGSAFEQLLRGDASKYKLASHFADLFRAFGNVTVADVQKTRPEIQIDQTDPARAAAQPTWWVHQKWMEELYDLRSKVVHKGATTGRAWGWSVFEHLVMAAYVFPLVVKLLLAGERVYALSDEDRIRCLTVDKILASPQWYEDPDAEKESEQSAAEIMLKTRFDLMWDKARKAALEQLAGGTDAR